MCRAHELHHGCGAGTAHHGRSHARPHATRPRLIVVKTPPSTPLQELSTFLRAYHQGVVAPNHKAVAKFGRVSSRKHLTYQRLSVGLETFIRTNTILLDRAHELTPPAGLRRVYHAYVYAVRDNIERLIPAVAAARAGDGHEFAAIVAGATRRPHTAALHWKVALETACWHQGLTPPAWVGQIGKG
jgi:hypothetical protein